MTLDEMYAKDQCLQDEINRLIAERYELTKLIVAAETEFSRRSEEAIAARRKRS